MKNQNNEKLRKELLIEASKASLEISKQTNQEYNPEAIQILKKYKIKFKY